MGLNIFKSRDLQGKIAIVTGASSGIGRVTALALAKAGVNLALAARREELLREVSQEIEAIGQKALVVPTDVTKQDQVHRLVEETLSRWGQIDILIVNAGQYVRAPVRALSVEDLQHSMSINFYGGVHSVLSVLPHLLARGSGHIVLMATLDAKKGLPLDAPYVAAKFALSGFGEVMRQELHDTGVEVSTIYPGRVDTPLIDNLKVPLISAKINPEAVAKATLRAIRRRRPEMIVPKYAGLIHYINVLSPRLGDWAVRVFRLEGWETE